MKLLIALVTYLLACVSAVPAQLKVTDIMARSETLISASLASDVLTFNIDPDENTACGYTEQVNINVKDLGDPATTSSKCYSLYLYIINTIPNGKASKDVDLVYTCPGTPQPTDPEGYGFRNIKFILNAPPIDAFPHDQTRVPATLRLLNIIDGADFTMPIEIGYKITGASELLWQYICCS